MQKQEYIKESIQSLSENAQIQLAKFLSKQKNYRFPIKMSEVQQRIRIYLKKNSQNIDQDFRKAVTLMNIKAAGKQLQAMLQLILQRIEKYIDRCIAQHSLRPIYRIIQQELVKQVYGKSYSIQRDLYKDELFCGTPQGTEKKEGSIKQYTYDAFFEQLYELLFLLSTGFVGYYQLPNNCDLQRFVIESFNDFAIRNSQSKIVTYDQKSLIKADKTTYMGKIGNFFYRMFRKKEEPEQTKCEQSNISQADTIAVIEESKQDNIEWIKNNANEQNLIRKGYQYIGSAYNYIAQKYQKQQSPAEKQNVSLMTAALLGQTQSMMLAHLQIFERKLISQEQKVRVAALYDHTNLQLCHNLTQKYQTILIQNCIAQLDGVSCKDLKLKEQIIKQFLLIIENLSNVITVIQQSPQKQNEEFLFNQTSIIVTLLYKSLHCNYDPYRRRILKKIIQSIQNQIKSPINLISILRVLERLGINQEKQTQLCKQLRQEKFRKQQFPLKFDEKNPKNMTQTALQIEHQINRIYLMEFKKQYPIEKFMINRICERQTRSKIVNICISGFLSQDTDKIKQWSKLISEMPESQVYAINWASKSIKDMVEFVYTSVKDIIFTNAGLGAFAKFGGPYLRAIGIAYQIYKKYNQNPFNPAFDCGKITGYYLAQLLISTFSHSFINLIGFSLGTEVIKSTLQRLSQRNKLNMINRVIMMGGAADKKELEKIIQNAQYPIDIVNCYSTNDSILKYMLRVCRPLTESIGRNQISIDDPLKKKQEEIQLDHKIENIDCTEFINGHGDYRSKMHILGKLMDLRNQ